MKCWNLVVMVTGESDFACRIIKSWKKWNFQKLKSERMFQTFSMERIQVLISMLEICFMHRMTMNRDALERCSSKKANKNLKCINLNSRKLSKSAQRRPMPNECLNLTKSLGRNFCKFTYIFALDSDFDIDAWKMFNALYDHGSKWDGKNYFY